MALEKLVGSRSAFWAPLTLATIVVAWALVACAEDGSSDLPQAGEKAGISADSGSGDDAGEGSAVSGLAAPADLRSRTHGSDWPTFLGPTGDGKSPETGLLFEPSRKPPVVWETEVGEGFSAPTVALGRLFVFDRQGDAAVLRCFHAETGELLWRTEYATDYEDMYGYSPGPRTSPVVDGARVFTYGAEGRLRALRVDDGSLLWEVDTAERYGVLKNFFGVGSTPAVFGELLITQVGGSPEGSPGIQSGKARANGTGIVAFDIATGKEVYRLADELASYSSPVLTEIGGQAWGFVFARGGLVAFDPVDGNQRWQFPWRAKKLESVNAANPVLVGQQIFLTESYGPGSVLLEIGAKSAEVVWQDPRRNQSLSSHWATPIHVDGILYAASGQSSGEADLRAVEMATGKVLWKQPGLSRATLLYVDGHLVALGEYGELRVFEASPDAYSEVADWTPRQEDGVARLRFPAWNAPVLAQGMLYVRGKSRLLALDAIPPRAGLEE